MSATVAVEQKKTRRMSISGLFGSTNHKSDPNKSSRKMERKVSIGIRKSLHMADVTIEEATSFTYDVKTATEIEDNSHIVNNNGVEAVKFPIPHSEFARNALNREIRTSGKGLSRKKKNQTDSSSHRSIWDSFRSSQRPQKFSSRNKSKDKSKNNFAGSKSAIFDFSYAGANMCPINESTKPVEVTYGRNNSETHAPCIKTKSLDVLQPLVSRELSNNSTTSEDEDFVPTRRVHDLSSIKVMSEKPRRRNFPKNFEKSYLSDDDGMSSGSNPAPIADRSPSDISVRVFHCSTSDSSESFFPVDSESDYVSTTAPATPCGEPEEPEDPFMSLLIQGSITLPRQSKKKKSKNGKLKKKTSKSQESLLTTIMNAVTKRSGKNDGDEVSDSASFADASSSSESNLVATKNETKSTESITTLVNDSTSYISKFTTWEGRSAATLPRHRKIGNIGKLNDLNLFCSSIR